MLNVLCGNRTNEEAEKIFGKPVMPFPDIMMRTDYDIEAMNDSEWFRKVLGVIDDTDLIARNVIHNRITNWTGAIEKCSTGVKCLYIMSLPDATNWVIESQWLGSNCIQFAIDIAEKQELYIVDNSDMFFDVSETLHGFVRDFLSGTVIDCSTTDIYDWYLEHPEYA